MTDYGTIRVPKDVYDRANEERNGAGETWAEFLERAIDTEPRVEMTEEDVRRLVRDEVERYVSTHR